MLKSEDEQAPEKKLSKPPKKWLDADLTLEVLRKMVAHDKVKTK